jgi:Ca-activated chloride channel family protein
MVTLFGYVFSGLAPLAALGAAALGTAALVALYLLRERERRVRVAFVRLWEPEAGSRRIERLGRRLRRWLSLALQLVLLWLLLLALIDPRPATTAPAARTWVVLVDRSASMSARQGGRTRLEEARRQAHQVIDALGSEDRVLVASFGREVIAESGFEADGVPLHAAVERIEVAGEPADLRRALTFAGAVMRGRSRPTVVVIGDGVQEEPAPPGLEVRWIPVGQVGPNLALRALSARRRATDPATVEVSAVVESFGDRPARAILELRTGREARTVERVPLTLGPRDRLTRALAVTTAETQLEARLVPTTADVLAADDLATTTVAAPRRRRVLLVAGPNLYLDGALLSFGGALAVERIATTAVEPSRPRWDRYDVVIFDGVTPAPPPTAGRFLYLDPHGAGSPWLERGLLRDPVPTDVDRRHPLLAQLALGDLNIRESRRLSPAADDHVVASAFGVPLVLARARPGLRMVGLAFDVRRSDLPLRPSFPLLLANAFDWLDGKPTGSTTAAVEGLDPRESDTARAPALILAGQPQRPWSVPLPARGRPWGTLALLAALALSLVEWATHQRRWTV